MIERESYSPRLRTALVLNGIGTGGAYHAGVLRALQEAGVKIDVVAGRGIGVVGALFAAVDGGERLWGDKGFWRSAEIRTLYPWNRIVRFGAGAVALAAIVVAVPLAALVLGLAVFPLDFVARMLGAGGTDGAGGLAGAYLQIARAAFSPDALPTWLPRIVVLVIGGAVTVVVCWAWVSHGARRRRGPVWWRLMPPPLARAEAVEHCWRVMWNLLRGAAQVKQPRAADVGRSYTELLAENLGQPGFRELLIAVHDLDTHRDLLFALVAESRRRDLFRRATIQEADERRADVLELHGVAREYLSDALAAALAIPLATAVHSLTFEADSFWCGESHRLCDRPGAVTRLLEELAGLGVEQAILVSAAPESTRPHALVAPRLDWRALAGECLQSTEAAAIRDLMRAKRPPRLFAIRPGHNPIGPFDFGGGYDDASDRPQPLAELMSRGYEDAHQQFIEPVLAASGDGVGA